MAFSPTTLATNIAALSISGVTIKAISTTPDLITARDVPLLVPAPDFVTGIVGVPISMGIAGGAFYQYNYQAQYLFYLGAAGGERITATQRLACLQKIELIAAAIKAADTTLGPERVTLSGAISVQIMEDATGSQFIGSPISLDVVEYL